MAKVTLQDVTSGHAATTLINANNTATEIAIENTLSRDGTGPNQMEANLDMNGYRILNQSNPISVSGFNWEGSWVTSTNYSIGDVIENGGSAYICIVAHTSGTFATDLAAVKWQLVAQASLPSQTGKADYLLTTNGSTASWAAATAFIKTILDDTSASDVLSTLGFSAFGKTLIDDADATAALTTLGINSYAQSLLANTDAASARGTLGVSYGPAFSAYATANQSITSGVATKVTLGSEEIDTDNCFAASRFTPNVAGYYHITGYIMFQATNMIGYVAYLYKNGGLYKTGSHQTITASNSSLKADVNGLVYLNGTTDYVELYGSITGTTPKYEYTSAANASYFSGFLVRPA